MKGKAITKKTACCDLTVSLLRNTKGEIFDVEVVRAGEGGCKANLGVIKELLSIVIEMDGIDMAITCLKNHICGGCTSMRKRFEKEHLPICKSCGDAIARAMEELK